MSQLFVLKSSLIYILIYFLARIESSSKFYNVLRLEGTNKITHSRNSLGPMNIYCYDGTHKQLTHLWKSVTFHLEIETDAFVQYVGSTPDEVWNSYEADRSWLGNFFSSRKSRSSSLYPYNSTCVAIKTDQEYVIKVETKVVDYFKFGLMLGGVLLFLSSRSLCENVLFFYLSGITLGICASFMILIYFFSKLLPGKPVVYSAMIGGWTVSIYALQFIWRNFQPLIFAYRDYIGWYTFCTGIISFIICYKVGPPKDPRNKNLITWLLQAIGLASIYFSTDITEVAIGCFAALITIKYTPRYFVDAIGKYWKTKFPKKRVLLTKREYYEQGKKETAKALDELRGYCSSPECSQWSLMRKLQDPKRFASFIDGEEHVTGDENKDYDNSDFIIRRKNLSNNKQNFVSTVPKDEYLTSDDSSSSDDL